MCGNLQVERNGMTVEVSIRKWVVPTVLLTVGVVAGVIYLVIAYRYQADLFTWMEQLASEDPAVVGAASEKLLAAGDHAFPYLSSGLLNNQNAEVRLLCGRILLKAVQKRDRNCSESDESLRHKIVGRNINVEYVSRTLFDESPEVRDVAARIITLVGTRRPHQKRKLADRKRFEEMLVELKNANGTDRLAELTEQFVDAGVDSVPFLVGTLCSDDPQYRRRGMEVLEKVVEAQLRGANLKRVVQVLGRRRTQRLLSQLDDTDRMLVKTVRRLLSLSGKVKSEFFDETVSDLRGISRSSERRRYLHERTLVLERLEKGSPGVK